MGFGYEDDGTEGGNPGILMCECVRYVSVFVCKSSCAPIISLVPGVTRVRVELLQTQVVQASRHRLGCGMGVTRGGRPLSLMLRCL